MPLIRDPITARCTDLFNVGYEILLQTLERYFAHTEETDAQLATLAKATLAVMLRVLKPLGDLIPTLPVGPEHPGMTGGPSFELFYESDYLMPHRGAAWALLEERLREASAFCARLQTKAGVDESLAARLAPIYEALSDIADSLAGHFADWGAISRYTNDDSPAVKLDEPALDSLSERAAELAEAVSSTAITDPAGRSVQRFFTQAHGFLSTVLASGDSANGYASQLPRVATRLMNSVLRPPSEALTDRQEVGRPQQPGTDPPGKIQGEAPGSDNRLWMLAQTATQLRADLDSDATLLAAVAEAAAALQDLAVELAPTDGPDNVEARLARMQEIQTDILLGIQVATDGPYLVTNAATVYSWLGETLPVRPQMALCRSGQSAIKPLCDGSHARVGSAAKRTPSA